MTEPSRDEAGFTICPHCWHLNPPTRLCGRCFADTSTVLQESGGKRWTAAAQSPMPVRAGGRLSRVQRALLFGAVVLFALSQIALALAPASRAPREPAPAPQGRLPGRG